MIKVGEIAPPLNLKPAAQVAENLCEGCTEPLSGSNGWRNDGTVTESIGDDSGRRPWSICARPHGYTVRTGIIRAPMTSVFMIFELMQDYHILVPLMVANLLSFSISKRFQPVPVYNALLAQSGIQLPEHGSKHAA